jgi:two-component system nitrate/nitrite response regulator NarL
MDVSRRIVPQGETEPEIVLSIEEFAAEKPLMGSNYQEDDTPIIAISIVSNSRLLSEGLLPLLSPYLCLKLIATHLGAFHITSPLPNPHGHVVLLDSSVGRSAAMAWIRYWRGLISPANVLILELADDLDLILDCIEAGASGYTLQGASAIEVAAAINAARCGKAHCSPEVTSQLYERVAALRATVIQLSLSPLTGRESEILRFVASGYTNMEIATQLVIELRTVKQHVHHILSKLNSQSRGEAVRFAVDQGWLSEDYASRLNRE